MVDARWFGMNKGVFVILVLMFLGMVSAGDKVSVVVLDDIQEGDFGISESFKMNITHDLKSIGGFGAEIDSDDLEKVKSKYSKGVFVEDRVFSINLDVSVPQIGGNASWNLIKEGVNISGTGETVCVIDTGVNYSHPALGGCFGNNNVSSDCRVLGGYDFVGEDSDPMDDNGHGTHVAGIVASNDSTYMGVAPNSKIIAMKALDSSGTGNGADVLAAMDWCISNASKFNISVISMSFGDDSTYNYYCDGESAPWTNMINSAVDFGMPVVVSAGNCDKVGQTNCTIGVAFPACIKNATRAGTVDDSDVIDYMRGALFELMAPGINIHSTLFGGGFGDKSGTSMSAPHIAGSMVLMKQYLNLSEQLMSVDEIESVLNDSGIRLDDSSGSGYNFTRINVYDALLSLDVDSPIVSLVSPEDNYVDPSSSQSFVCNASDWQLVNVTFKIWNSSGLYYNESKNLTGISNETTFNVTNLSGGEYSWNCFVGDFEGNLGNASNFSFTIGGVDVRLDSPTNGSSTNVNGTNFSCTSFSASDYELDNVTFKIWNSSGVLVKNESRDISGVENGSIFNYTFLTEDEYTWNCFSVNNNSDEDSGLNFSISYDVTLPNITSASVSKTSSSAVISWNSDELTNSSVWVSGGSVSNSSDYVLNHSVSVSGLSASTSYSYIVFSCDAAGNCGNESGSFMTNAASSSGGGGGGSPTPSVSVVSIEPSELWVGKSEVLEVGDLVSFNLNSGSHSLEVSNIGDGYADIVIRSEPIYLTLIEGQEKKLNLSSSDYYDLVVGLDKIIDGEVNISVRRIFEAIGKEVEFIENESKEEERIVYITDEEIEVDKNWKWWIVVFVVCIFVVGWSVLRKKKFKRKRKKRRKRKSKKVSKRKRRRYDKGKKVKVKA